MMMEWIGKKLTKGAMRSAPREILDGVVDIVKKPPQDAINLWNSLSQEDKDLFSKAALAAARLAAKGLIAADQGGKAEF